MSDKVTVGKNVQDLRVNNQLAGYSGVRINCGEDEEGNIIEYFAGDETGRVLRISNPWGSQAQANAILAKVRGWQMQPFDAYDTIVNPAIEMGDGLSVNGAYGGVAQRYTDMDPLMASDLSSPEVEEIDEDVEYQSKATREYSRFKKGVAASLKVTASAITAEVNARTAADQQLSSQLSVQATQIAAKVSATGGDNSSFGWRLTSAGFYLYSGGSTVLKATSSGVEVTGKITATSGKIGGFTISSTAIYNKINSMSASGSSGVYLGTDGLRLGSKFKVDSSGNLNASSGTFTGAVYASNIQYGSTGGYFSGGGISGGSVSGSKLGESVRNDIANGVYAYDVVANSLWANNIYSYKIHAQDYYALGSYVAKWRSITYNGVTINYLGR